MAARADGAKLLKRLDQMKPRRLIVEETWRDSFRYTYPLRGVGFDLLGAPGSDSGSMIASAARAAQADLLDGTGTDGARILASGLQSGLTPANSRWPGLETGDETDEERRWLDESADFIWQNIHSSNFDAISFDCMLDMAIAGQFPMFFDTDPEEGGYRFDQWPLANTWCAASRPSGPIDIAFNEFPLSAEQALKDYGPEMLSEKVRELAKDKPDEQIEFVRCVYPREGAAGQFSVNLPYASVHLEKATKKVVRESGYHEMPLGVPRWRRIPGSPYAFGPASEALPDMKTLNTATMYELANMDLATAGMWGAVDDGVLNPRSIRVGPRKVIVMSAKDNFFPLTPGGDYQVALLNIERLQRSVRRIFMADQLEPQMKAGTPPTATEILVRVELIRQLLGPVYGTMMSEYLQWLVRRAFGLAFRDGALPPVPRSILQRGRSIGVTYNSPIARAQKSVDVGAMDRYEASLANQAAIVGETPLDMYNWDDANRHRAELLGVPAKLIPDEDAIEERRARRAEQQQQASMADLAGQAALEKAKQSA